MVVQHNLQAMNASRMLGVTTSAQSKSTEKLSSGYRINRAADDAAGLTISEKMRKQIRGLDQASTNAQDGVSAVQTAEGALTEVHSMLQRMNELAVQAANGTNSETDRDAIQAEIKQLTTEIDRVSETTKFNETYLLKGNTAGRMVTKTVNAHDAGLAGKLVDNGDGTSSFAADALAVGDTVNIGGTEYTIGKSKNAEDYIKQGDLGTAVTAVKAGDSITSRGVTSTVVDKADEASAGALTWANGDTFVDADGKEWTVADATDESKGQVATGDVSKYLKAGSTITKNAAAKVGTDGADEVAKTVQVVDELADDELSSVDTDILDKFQNASVGDVLSVDGKTLEVTAEEPKAFSEIADAIKGLSVDNTVTIGNKEYTVAVASDPEEGKLTADEIIALIEEGDTVDVNGDTYTAIGVSATDSEDSNTITLDEAYKKMADALEKASSIGADAGKGAKVQNHGSGRFTITKGTVKVKEDLSFNLHVGADADMTNKISVKIESMSAAGLGIQNLDVYALDENGEIIDDGGITATYAIDAIADAVAKVSAQRSALGAVQNRLEHTIANLDNVVENTTSAESRIRDTDMAEEMVEYSKNNILAQAGQSMLAQSNQSTQGVLSLLQ